MTEFFEGGRLKRKQKRDFDEYHLAETVSSALGAGYAPISRNLYPETRHPESRYPETNMPKPATPKTNMLKPATPKTDIPKPAIPKIDILVPTRSEQGELPKEWNSLIIFQVLINSLHYNNITNVTVREICNFDPDERYD